MKKATGQETQAQKNAPEGEKENSTLVKKLAERIPELNSMPSLAEIKTDKNNHYDGRATEKVIDVLKRIDIIYMKLLTKMEISYTKKLYPAHLTGGLINQVSTL